MEGACPQAVQLPESEARGPDCPVRMRNKLVVVNHCHMEGVGYENLAYPETGRAEQKPSRSGIGSGSSGGR